uniref:Uncharacterized protein n=1 Tax=Arundo donax TaxID=35708 RepID=A0A0A8Y3M6_ARUDO
MSNKKAIIITCSSLQHKVTSLFSNINAITIVST